MKNETRPARMETGVTISFPTHTLYRYSYSPDIWDFGKSHYSSQGYSIQMSKSMDSRAKRDELRAALTSRDPFVVASVLQVPPIAPAERATPSPLPCKESMEYNGQDWTPVLSNWVDACNYALAVRQKRLYTNEILITH